MRLPCWLRRLFGMRCAPPRPPVRLKGQFHRRTIGGKTVSTETLNWIDPTQRTDTSALAPSAIAQTNILDAINGAPSVQIGSVPGAAETYTTGPLVPGIHIFTAVTVDTAGNASLPSAPFSVTVPAPLAPPNPPTGLTGTFNP
jgi:hypothetical protein